jgi:hypothetical protein
MRANSGVGQGGFGYHKAMRTARLVAAGAPYDVPKLVPALKPEAMNSAPSA